MFFVTPESVKWAAKTFLNEELSQKEATEYAIIIKGSSAIAGIAGLALLIEEYRKKQQHHT